MFGTISANAKAWPLLAEGIRLPDCDPYRSATKWSPGGPTLRLHIGLENVDDFKADLDRGFAALKAAA